MMGKIIASITLGASVFLVLVLQTSTPMSVGPLGIIGVFFLIYLSALGVLTFLLYGIYLLISRFSRSNGASDRFSLKQAYYYASVLALAPVIIIAQQSVGRASVYDVVLVVVFEIIAVTYIAKRQK